MTSGNPWLFILPLFASVALGQIEIDSVAELQLIGNDPGYPLNGSYVLAQDIDASATANPAGPFGPQGFVSIGDFVNPFTGTFDGQGYEIDGLLCNSTAGLFYRIEAGAAVRNVVLTNVSITTPMGGGGITLYNHGEITNCHVQGTVTALTEIAGGVVGYQQGTSATLSNCSFDGAVSGEFHCGGLVGYAHTTLIEDGLSSGTVSGTASRIGGLAGFSYETTIRNSASSSSVSGHVLIGGLVGEAQSNSLIERSFATGGVTAWEVGAGLVGALLSPGGTITDCFSRGASVTLQDPAVLNNRAGGLFGVCASTATATNSYSTTAPSGPGNKGGVAGASLASAMPGVYWDTQASGMASAFGTGSATPAPQGRTTAQMTHPHDAGTYVGWDFDNVWAEDTAGSVNNGYPYLRWYLDDVFTLTYQTGANGGLSGTLSQSVRPGRNGQWVTAVADPGYQFDQWSDGVTDNPRKDRLVDAGKTVTAQFVAITTVGDWRVVGE